MQNKKLSIFSAYKLVLFEYCNNTALLILLFFCIAITIVAVCINPLIFRTILDSGLPSHNIHLLIILLGLALLIFLISVVSSFIQYHAAAKIGVNIISQLRLKMFQSIQNLNFKQDENEFNESVLVRLTKDIGTLEYSLIYTIWLVIQYTFIGIISICLLFYINWIMTLLVAALMPFIILWPKWFFTKASSYAEEKTKFETKIFTMGEEAIFMQDVIRLLRIKNFKRKTFKHLLKAERKLNYQYNANVGIGSRSAFLVIQFITLVILGTGLILLMTNHLTLGSLVGFLILLGNFGSAVNVLTSHYPSLIHGAESINRIIGLIDTLPKTKNKHHGNKLSAIKNSIVFDNVSVQSSGKQIISNIDLKILAGEYVAFVGPSGAGKTTILKLLLREHSAMKGAILLDGKDLQTFSLNSIYKQIGVVTQQPKLFVATIKENIRLGKLTAKDDEIIAAAKLAEVHEDIMALPEGYETNVSATTLSGGQKQRITIARALIAKPSILCLDEATASVDPHTAAALDETFRRMTEDITVLSITHRLRSAIHANRIFMIEKGRIVEAGTHAELMQKAGLYYQAWQKQHGVLLTENPDEIQIDIRKLKNIPLFSELDDITLNKLKNKFLIEHIQEDKIVVEEGDVGNKFYIILTGLVDISKLDPATNKMKIIASINDGDYFGEIALLYNIPRVARITTKSACIFLTLDRQSFHQFFIKLPKEIQTKIIVTAQERIGTT